MKVTVEADTAQKLQELIDWVKNHEGFVINIDDKPFSTTPSMPRYCNTLNGEMWDDENTPTDLAENHDKYLYDEAEC